MVMVPKNKNHPWEPEPAKFHTDNLSLFVCNVCMKTFYNQEALRNHKNITHDVLQANGEEIVNRNNCLLLGKLALNLTDDHQLDLFVNEHLLWPAHAFLRYEIKLFLSFYLILELKEDCFIERIYESQDSTAFTFIPINPEDKRINNSIGFISRTFTEDTSYLIVKVDEDDGDSAEHQKESHPDTKIQEKNSSVDLRGPFTCTLPSTMCPDLQCRQIFFSCCEYSLHYREEHTKRRKAALRCQVCEKPLDRNMHGNSRLATEFHAANVLVVSCAVCGMKYLDEASCEEHNRLMHKKMKPHQCSICYKRFAQQGGLQQHLRMHTGIRPFVCSFCPKAFTQKAGLDQHLRIHTKVKPYKCVICSKCFSQSVHLRQHMRTHTNIQPFECSVCSKRFKQRSHLNFHLRSHMNEAGIAVADRFEEEMQNQNEIDFFSLSELQPVHDGEFLYYAPKFTIPPPPEPPQPQPESTIPNSYVNDLKFLPVL